jgi:CheY-like chemotaxis protein
MAVVLVAEDDRDITFILIRVLNREGHVVHHAPDGAAARDLAVEIRPDIVLSDLGMPRMDGLQLCSAIRADPSLSGTPVALLTGSLLPADPRAAEAAVCAVLLKPCNNAELATVMAQLAELGPHEHGSTPSRCPLAPSS